MGQTALSIGVVLAVVVALPAQEKPGAATAAVAQQREAMKKLHAWIGTWKGTGWMMRGPGNRQDFAITETIQPKLGGLALLVEGEGKGKNAAGEEFVAHNALAVVTYEPDAKHYRFRHYTMQGRSGEDELKIIDGGYEWSLREEKQNVTIRFTIKLSENEWHEVGEVTRDGKTWFKMLEMSLKKQK